MVRPYNLKLTPFPQFHLSSRIMSKNQAFCKFFRSISGKFQAFSGKYERQHFVSADHADERGLEKEKENNPRESAKSADRHAKERAFMELRLF